MKKLAAVCAAALLSLPAWALSPADITARLQTPANVQGGFKQERFIKSLNTPMQTQGTFVLQKNKGLLWQVSKPFELRLRVRADGIAQWDAKTRRWRGSSQSGQGAQVKLFMAVLGGDTTELQKQFTLQAEGSRDKWKLQLLPKTALMKQIFKQIHIEGDSLVRRVELQETQGERTVMHFSQLQTDKPLDPFARQALQ